MSTPTEKQLHNAIFKMLRPIATTAYQTMAGQRRKRERPEGAPASKPHFLDSCHALATTSMVDKEHWPEFYTGDDGS